MRSSAPSRPRRGCGRPSIGDLARYASACQRPPPGPLGAAITAAQAPQFPVEAGGHQALAWRVSAEGIRWHTGSTGGFSAAVLIDPVRERMFAEWLDLSWRDRTRDLGQPVGFQVSCWGKTAG